MLSPDETNHPTKTPLLGDADVPPRSTIQKDASTAGERHEAGEAGEAGEDDADDADDAEGEDDDEGEDDEDQQYFDICEGQHSELLGHAPKRIIAQAHGFIVYITPENHARVVAAVDQFPKGYGDIANLVVDLEAAPTHHLTAEQTTALRVFGGHALVRCVDEHDFGAARAVIERGWRYYRERSAEVSRRWYLVASVQGFVAISISVLAGCVWPELLKNFGVHAPLLYFSFLAGGAGAFISIVFRLGSVCSDPSGGRSLHRYESFARLLVGCLTGLTFSLALLGGVALRVVSSIDRPDQEIAFYFCIFVAVISGASERAIPDLVSSSKLGNSSAERAGGNGP